MEFRPAARVLRASQPRASRDRLLDLAHGKDIEPFDRSTDTRIARIRQKVEISPAHLQAIRTVRGAGYMFVPGAQS